jgi:hypothetical protein
MDSSPDPCGEHFTDAKDIPGLGVHATWKSVLLSPNRGCENTFCCLTPGLLASFLSFFPPFLPRNISLWYKLSKEKQVKLLKMDFQKSGNRTHSSGVRHS